MNRGWKTLVRCKQRIMHKYNWEDAERGDVSSSLYGCRTWPRSTFFSCLLRFSMFHRMSWWLINLACFWAWHSGKATVSHGKSFLWVLLFGLLPRFVSGLLFPRDETQIWLGDLRVVLVVGLDFRLMCVDLPAWLDQLSPCTNDFACFYLWKDRATVRHRPYRRKKTYKQCNFELQQASSYWREWYKLATVCYQDSGYTTTPCCWRR